MEKSVEEKAIAKGLLTEAKAQAVKAVEAALAPMAGEDGRVVVS